MKTYFSTNRILATTVLSVGLMTVFFACKKDNGDDSNSTSNVAATNSAVAAVSNESAASAGFSDVFEVAYQGGSGVADQPNNARAAGEPGAYYGYTFDVVPLSGWPKTVTLTFDGTTAGKDGKTRSGVIVLTLPHAFLVPGTVVTVATDNYTVNGRKVTGTETLTNNSTNSAINFNQIIAGSISVDDTTTFTYNSNKTLIIDTDGFKGIGSAKLVYEKTKDSASVTVTDTLVKAWSCAFIGKGKATITRGKISGTIDYGAGVCDDSATVVVGNNTKGIHL